MSGNKIMDGESISTLLITANVGSLFEDVSFFLFDLTFLGLVLFSLSLHNKV